jgi:hypothetical protein
MRITTQVTPASGTLLIGPYDPNVRAGKCVASSPGVVRRARALEATGVRTKVFDPNACEGVPAQALACLLMNERWDRIDMCTTDRTLRYDLELAHLARRMRPDALLVAAGDTSCAADLLLKLGPFDQVVHVDAGSGAPVRADDEPVVLAPPRGRLEDIASTIREAVRSLVAGGEIRVEPWTTPSWAAARDPELAPHVQYTHRRIFGTAIEFDEPTRILPIDPQARAAIVTIERDFSARMRELESHGTHATAGVHSLVWVLCAIEVLARYGQHVPGRAQLEERLERSMPPRAAQKAARVRLRAA